MVEHRCSERMCPNQDASCEGSDHFDRVTRKEELETSCRYMSGITYCAVRWGGNRRTTFLFLHNST